MKKRFAGAIAFLIVCVSILFAIQHFTGLKNAPEIQLSLINGEKFNLANIPSKHVLISFWATSCAVCVAEIPEMSEFYTHNAGENFELIAVAMPYDPPDRILRMSEEKQIPYPIAIDIQGEAMLGFDDVSVTPTHFLLAKDGSIISKTRGKLDFAKLKKLIQQG